MRKQPFLVAAAAGALIVHAPALAQAPPRPAPAQRLPGPGEPIVPDSQFERALPPLDPVLQQPLEPLDAIQPPVDPNAPPPPPFPPVPGPVEDAPLGDPALSEPLPPLSTFESEAIQETQLGEVAEPAPVRYDLVVNGLDEVDLRGRFLGLSALEDARGEAVNGAMIQARAEEDVALAIRLLRSEGYYDGVATSAIEQLPAPEGQQARLRVTITAAPGQRYRLGEIRLVGPETVPPGLAREAFRLQSGAPIVAADVESAEANILLRLPQQGYPFAELGLRDIELDPQTALGAYTLPVETGPRTSFRRILTEGTLAFDVAHVGLLSRFRQDQLYDRRLVDDLREAMVSTRLFQTVSAEPVRTGEAGPDGTEYVDILVRQEAGPARTLDLSAGFSTGEGFRLEGAWEHRNLVPPEGALRLAAIAGTAEQSANVRFRRSNWGRRDRALILQLEAGQRDYEAYQGYTARLSGLVVRESTPIWQKVWTWQAGAEILATNESREGRARLSLSDAYFIGGLVGQIGYDRSNSLLDPTRGFRLSARVNPEASLRDGADFYLRTLLDGSAYYPVGENFVLAGRVRFGSLTGIARDDLAPSRRFYAGGGGSVRGFGFQQLGPRDIQPNPAFDPADPEERDPPTISVPLGGRSLAEFAIEGRYRFGDYGVVAFVDAGQVYEAEYPTFSSMRFGVGIGGRVYTNFGPVRLDIATPIGRRPGEALISVYVSIGQAF